MTDTVLEYRILVRTNRAADSFYRLDERMTDIMRLHFPYADVVRVDDPEKDEVEAPQDSQVEGLTLF